MTTDRQTPRLSTNAYDGVVADGAWLEDADGVVYGPGTKFRHERDVREVWTNGSGMFGPADGIDRPIGHVVERDEVTVDGRVLPGPVQLRVRFPLHDEVTDDD